VKIRFAIADLLRREGKAVGLQVYPMLLLALCAVVLIIPRYHSGTSYWRLLAWLGGDGLVTFLRRAGLSFSFAVQVGLPVIFILASRGKLRESGLGLGHLKVGLKMCVLFYGLYVPCFIALPMNTAFRTYYARAMSNPAPWSTLFTWQLLSTAMTVFACEFLFRGFLLFGMEKHHGPAPAILIHLMPYVFHHMGKPEIEILGSFPVGLALAYLAVKTRSIWYGVLLHASIAWLLNAAVLIVHQGQAAAP